MFKCGYCHNDGQRQFFPEVCTPDDYEHLFAAFNQEFGSKRVVLSGGEPLLREEVDEIAHRLHIAGAEITLVTNGALLNRHRSMLKYLHKLHISLDTMDSELFNQICNTDAFEQVVDNITFARRSRPSLRIKINSVLLRGINTQEQEIEKLLALGEKNQAINCFIEKMSLREDPEFIDTDDFEKILIQMGLKLIDKNLLKATLSFGNNQGRVELIRCFCPTAGKTIDPATFCNVNNNTLFINPDRSINPCPHAPRLIDLDDGIYKKSIDILQKELRSVINGLGFMCPLDRKFKI